MEKQSLHAQMEKMREGIELYSEIMICLTKAI